MAIRIQLSPLTVKALHSRLQQAYHQDEVRLVRRLHVLLDLLVHHVAREILPVSTAPRSSYPRFRPLWD